MHRLGALGIVWLGIVSLTLRGGDPAKKFELSELEKELLQLTNEERKKEKLPPLKANPLLFKVARAHAANMAKQGKMEHNLDGKTPGQRLKQAGYKYGFSGENIASGDYPLAVVMKAWMESAGHRKNILGKNFTEIGLGIVKDPKGVPYFAQVFAKPLR